MDIMLKLRTTRTASGKTAVQVVSRSHHKTEVVKHIGSAATEDELRILIKKGERFAIEASGMTPLLPEIFGMKQVSPQTIIEVEQAVKRLSVTASFHTFAHEFLSCFYELNGFTKLQSELLRDLAFMRIIEPGSKLQAITLLKKYFEIMYARDVLYKGLPKLTLLKEDAEKIAVSYAKKTFDFDFTLVFYDVSTLYFETFTADEDTIDEKGQETIGLRKTGFGKEYKPGQPQVLIGLVVTREGYPINVDLFPGNTFEGHTIIPVINNLRQKYTIETFTIVADAAMLSVDNIRDIKDANLSYIVGARMGKLGDKLLGEVAENLNKTEGIYYTTQTKFGTLVCDYSKKRAAKDRTDRKKQLAKAREQIDNPEKVKRKRRFVMEETKAVLKLNEALIAQDELKEGIKGYYTNLPLDDKVTPGDIANRYHDLWRVEKAFRIAKSDLEARPVFLHERKSIEAHILIVFISLCLSRSIEHVTGYSIKKIKEMIWDVLDITLMDTPSGTKFVKRMDTTANPMAGVLEKLQEKC